MNVVGIDQSRQLVRLGTILEHRSVSVRVTASSSFSQLRPSYRLVSKTSGNKACSAKFRSLRSEHGCSPSHVVRCAAAQPTAVAQPASASLPDQVDRLTSLLHTLDGAASWHDKVNPHSRMQNGSLSSLPTHQLSFTGTCSAR